MMKPIALALAGLVLAGSSALALDRRDLPRLERLSRELVLDADRVHDESELNLRRFSRDQMRMARSLNRFTDAAERFRDSVVGTDGFRGLGRQTALIDDAVGDLNAEATIIDQYISRIPSMSLGMRAWDRASRTLARINRIVRDSEPEFQAVTPERPRPFERVITRLVEEIED